MPMQAQAALEQAVAVALQAAAPAGLGWPSSSSHRTYDGQPPPSVGQWFAAVWSDGRRNSDGQRTKLSETFGVYVTITVRFTQPFDRWLAHRDDLEQRANAVKVLVCQDMLSFSIINAANTLAGFRNAGTGDATKPVGWCESLRFDGFDAIQDVGPDWFHAKPNQEAVGIAQRVKFGGALRIQGIAAAT